MKKILGLVLELNPFHLGHEYFINEAKKIVNPDVTITIISSNFTMRGEPMLIDKFSKTKMLIDNGCSDLVLELPFISGVNSSDFFTKNSISILHDFQITDLCFGAETDDINILYQIIDILDSNSYQIKLKEYLDKGFSFSTSSFKAIQSDTTDIEILKQYPLPNNTLAIGYLRAIKGTNIKPHIIKRIDNDYYDENINDNGFCSASSLRKLIDENKSIDKYVPSFINNYNIYTPSILNNNLFYLLRYRLLSNNLNNISLVYEGIENRLISFIHLNTYEEFIKNVQTKRYPENKIRRLILHILLDIPKNYDYEYTYYLRVLGMNSRGKKHISNLPKEIKEKIITSFKNKNEEIIKIELTSTKLYGIICNNYEIYKEEFNIPYRKD